MKMLFVVYGEWLDARITFAFKQAIQWPLSDSLAFG
jgi:hypothetical protein